MAKAPVTGRVKTRLGAVIGMEAAAQVAAASLLDTLATCRRAFRECHLALDGDLTGAHREDEIRARLGGWVVHPQRGSTLGERLARAHAAVAGAGPTVQVGMDTPQMSVRDLHDVTAAAGSDRAVLGPATDGGWWVLAVEDSSATSGLPDVPMSTAETFARTRTALEAAGLPVVRARSLRDVDTAEDAEAVARELTHGHFRDAWLAVAR